MVSQIGGRYELNGCRLLSSSAPGVHHGEHRSISAKVLDDAVVPGGGAYHDYSVGTSLFSSSNQLRVTWSWVTGSSDSRSSLIIKNVCPSGATS